MYGLTAIAKDYRAKVILDLSYKKFELEWWAKENLNGGLLGCKPMAKIS